MALDAFSDGRWIAHNSELGASDRPLSPAQSQNFLRDFTNSIVELWRANLARFTSLSQIEEFKSKTLYARLWQES